MKGLAVKEVVINKGLAVAFGVVLALVVTAIMLWGAFMEGMQVRKDN